MVRKKKANTNIFFKSQPHRILLNIYNCTNYASYPSRIAKEIDCTYPHTIRLLRDFEQIGLVKSYKNGRIVLLTLTEKGKIICNNLSMIISELENNQDESY